MCLRAVFLIIGGDGGFGIDTGNIIPPVYDVTSSDVEVVGDPAVDDLIEPDVIILHGIDVTNPGVGAQPEAGLRVFHEVDIADEIELVSFCPDIGFEGNRELFILGVVRAGGDGGYPGTGVYAEGAVAGKGDGGPGGQGIAYGRQERDGQFVDLLYAVGLFFMGKEEMKFVGNIFLGNPGVINCAVPGMPDGFGDGEGGTFASLGIEGTGE